MIREHRNAIFSIIFLSLYPVFSGLISCEIPEEKKPLVILTNSAGEKAERIAALDSLFGSFSHLLPNTRYEIRVIRSDGMEMSYFLLSSDENGIIPSTALWWDVGVEYSDSREGKFNPDALSQYTYSCQISREKRIVADVPIVIQPIEDSGPIIYSSTNNGNPLNGFAYQKENVYVTGKNFPAGAKLTINLVRDQYSWEEGDRLEPVLTKARIVQLDQGQTDFTTLIWSSDDTTIGSYDIVVEHLLPDEVYDRRDTLDSRYAVGFTIFRLSPLPQPPTPPPSHIEADLACQAPPQDTATGTVIGAPNPVYKDVFAPIEQVWVAVNPYTSGKDYVGKTARLYVVYDMDASGWTDGATLSDVSSDNYEVTTIQPGCANVNYTKVWSNPTIREEGYDVVVDFAPFGVYNKGLDIIDRVVQKGFIVPAEWICLESVKFNHNQASNTSDALNIRINVNEDVVVPEWQKAKQTYAAAYIRNKTITIKAAFSAATTVTSAKIRASVGYGALGALTQKTVTFINGSSGDVSFNVVGLTPSDIRTFYQKWQWYSSDVNSSGSPEIHLSDSKNRIYITLAEPQSPWTQSGQTKPWTVVLNKSCLWAWGETTAEGAAAKIAKRIYNDLGGYYQYGPQYTSSTTQDFKLTNFLSNIPVIGNVNCYDMGKSLVIFSNIVGSGLSYKYSSPFGSLNCEKAVGRPWNCSEGFGNHGFGSISNNIFDACLTIDTDSQPDAAPYMETWMLNEPWTSYATKVVKSGSPGTPVPYVFSIY